MTATSQLRNVFLCYNTQTDQVFATWNDTSGVDFYPTYSIYSNNSWSVPSVIDTSVPLLGGDVFPCYNAIENTIIATWGSDSGVPTYSIYSGGSWSVPASIAPGSVAGLNVYTCFNNIQNQVIALWAEVNNGGIPAYAIFNTGVWSAPLSIGTTGDADNVFPSYNSLTNEVFATWIDVQNNDYPTYSIYNGTTWSDPAVIAFTPAVGFALSLFSCYDSLHNQVFVAWANSPNSDPVYSIYSNGLWSSPAFINIQPPAVNRDIYLTYQTLNDKVFATWTDFFTSSPYYSIYADTQSLLPPTHLVGKKKSNKFATQTEWYNQLFWQPPATGFAPVSYRIYRDSLNTLISVVPAGKLLTFVDHNQKKSNPHIYYVVSVDANGNTSTPAIIAIK